MIVLSDMFVECDKIYTDVTHVSVSSTIDNELAGTFVAGDARLIVTGNIFCSI